MLAIIIPAHNEEDHIGAAVAAARIAASDPRLRDEQVELIVVLDECTDATAVRAAGARTLSVRARNVGIARAAGAEAALTLGARWLAFTDADSRVSPTWLSDQLALAADAVCGCIAIDDWSAHGAHSELLRAHFLETYADRDDHGHVHGANLGVSAQAYRMAGGFKYLACSEDVALVRSLEAGGARIAWSARPRLVTSARCHARAHGGFADALVAALALRLGALHAPTAPAFPGAAG
jgi:glycosyltransferase involved in cell wall biosynthesis